MESGCIESEGTGKSRSVKPEFYTSDWYTVESGCIESEGTGKSRSVKPELYTSHWCTVESGCIESGCNKIPAILNMKIERIWRARWGFMCYTNRMYKTPVLPNNFCLSVQILYNRIPLYKAFCIRKCIAVTISGDVEHQWSIHSLKLICYIIL